MKNINKSLSFLLLLALIVVAACKKEKNPSPSNSGGIKGNESNLEVKSSPYAKKWIVSKDHDRTETPSVYAWFDFSAYGHFVIRYVDGSYETGTYTYDATNNKLILKDYGVITITSLTTGEFSFVFTPEGESPVTIISSASTVVDTGSKTQQMARVWLLEEQTKDGSPTGILAFYDSAYVVITPYGTHMLVLKGGWMGDTYVTQVWKWEDATQAKVCVGSTTPVCDRPLTITLTKENKMIAEYPSSSGGTMKEVYRAMD